MLLYYIVYIYIYYIYIRIYVISYLCMGIFKTNFFGGPKEIQDDHWGWKDPIRNMCFCAVGASLKQFQGL